MYIEFLAQSFNNPDSVRNYMSGVTLYHKYLGTDCENMHSFEIKLMLRALTLTMRSMPNRRRPVTPDILRNLLALCPAMGPMGIVMKACLLLGFYGFLRQSNLAPYSQSQFDPSRNTCRADVILAPPGLVVLIKWCKTHQSGQNVALVPIPQHHVGALCPVQAFKELCLMCPAGPNSPLLLLPGKRSYVTVTTYMLSVTFSNMISQLGLSPTEYTLHSLRRGGASASFTAGAKAAEVQRHGLWSSESFWQYIVTPLDKAIIPKVLLEATS